jgi:hypothetical protein
MTVRAAGLVGPRPVVSLGEHASEAPEAEPEPEPEPEPELTEGERRVKELRDEVMEALTRLEQIDVEKKQQEN